MTLAVHGFILSGYLSDLREITILVTARSRASRPRCQASNVPLGFMPLQYNDNRFLKSGKYIYCGVSSDVAVEFLACHPCGKEEVQS